MNGLVKWIAVLLAAVSMIVGATAAFYQRPTFAQVEERINEKTAPVARAVEKQTEVLQKVTDQLQALREQAIRDEVTRELERREEPHR